MYSYRAQGTQGAHDNAQTIARDIAAYGFNTDFAPVADVWTNKRSNAIGDRAYSDDYDEAAELVAAAVKGFHDGGRHLLPEALPRPRQHKNRLT